MDRLLIRYHDALERIANLDGVKGFKLDESDDFMEGTHKLFSLVCKLKNIARDALHVDQIEAPTVDEDAKPLTGVIDPAMIP